MRFESVINAFGPTRRYLWKSRIERWNIGYTDAEQHFLPVLCDPRKLSIDIGASLGAYTVHLLACSRSVWAFEARPDAAAELQRTFASAPVRVHAVGLSDVDGEGVMRVCDSELGRSTLEAANQVQGKAVTVPLRRLDDLRPRDVGFMKIDVEGHECAVLQGCTETLRRDRPNLLVEIEDRHRAGSTRDVPALLEADDYTGWFLLEGSWRPMSSFEVGKHQCPGQTPYINNFVFVQKNRPNPLRTASPDAH